MPDHEVLVVGAGPVGLLLACLLSQRGIDVVVCERRGEPDRRTRAIGIHRPGLDALDAAGIGDAVRAEALALDGGEVRSRGRMLASLTFDAGRSVLVLPQPRTGALLRQRLSDLAPASVRERHTVLGVTPGRGSSLVRVESEDGIRDLTAGLVVVADGVRSGIRAELGRAWHPRAGRASYAMVDVVDETQGRRAILYCEPGGLVESFPLPGGRRRWVLRRNGADAGELTARAFRDEVQARTGILIPVDDADAPAEFVAAQHAARPLARDGVVLLGDAAHEVSPIGGQGMNLGWAAALVLAGEITRADVRMPAFAAYERTVRRAARRAQRRSAFYMAMGAPTAGLPLHARDGLIRALGSRPLRPWTADLITMRGL